MEMSLPFVIYFIETLLPVSIIPPFGLAIGTSILALIALGVIYILNEPCYNEEKTEYRELWIRAARKANTPYLTVMGLWCVLSFLGNLIPSTDTAYKILAAYGVQEFYTAASGSEEMQQISSKSMLLIEQSLDKYLELPVVEETTEE